MKNTLDKAMTSLKNGNSESLGTIYEILSKGVYSFILPILGNEQLAEDILQNTFIQVYQKRDQYKEGTSLRNWVLTISKNLALNELAKRKKEVLIDFDDKQNLFSYDMNIQVDTPLFDQAKKILDKDEYQILTMHIIGEMKHREIADALQIPLGTVTWLYKKAIDKLKKNINLKEVV